MDGRGHDPVTFQKKSSLFGISLLILGGSACLFLRQSRRLQCYIASSNIQFPIFRKRWETLWKKWFELAAQYSLANGEYLNLYDLAFDFPETHAIRKDGDMCYGLFCRTLHEKYSGEVELRGLDKTKTYPVLDYVITGMCLAE